MADETVIYRRKKENVEIVVSQTRATIEVQPAEPKETKEGAPVKPPKLKRELHYFVRGFVDGNMVEEVVDPKGELNPYRQALAEGRKMAERLIAKHVPKKEKPAKEEKAS